MEPKKSFEQPETKLHFLDYWRILRIRKTVIIAVFLLVALTTTLVTFILPESYASTVRIAVEKDAPDIASFGSAERNVQMWDPYWIQTQFEKIQSKLILYQVITNMNLNRRWAERFKEEGDLRTEVTYQLLKNQISVSQSRNTSLIEIRVYSEDKNEAANLANEIARVYKQSRRDRMKEVSDQGIKQLEDELAKVNQEFTNRQAQVDALKEKLGIPDAELQGGFVITTDLDRLRNQEARRDEEARNFIQVDTLYRQMTNLTRVEFRNAVLTAVPDGTLSTLMDQLHIQEQRYADFIAQLSDNHPDVQRARKVIEEINTQIEARLDGILTGLKVRWTASKKSLDEIESQISTLKEETVKRALDRREYFQRKRDLESIQFVRERLAVRIIQEKVDAALPKQGIVEVFDVAEPALRAVRPNKPLNIALGIIVGLAVGVGLAFFIEYLDTSVKTIDDVERALQAPVLGVIPQGVGALINEGPDSPHAEAYRVLRTNLLFSQKDPKLNTLTVVSGGTGEGKSTTVFNLATIFAQNGSRVLIIDSDLRRPSLHKILKVSNSIGLTNFLLKQNGLEEVIQTTQLPTLDFLPSGKLPSSSMGVLSSTQMKELIRDVKRRYDYVFFDSPPIMGVSDASILASEVDMVLQVIQYRRYPQPMTIRAKQMIEKVGGNLLGIVLNNINMTSDESYYYYSGYYYDYYGKETESLPDHAPKTEKSENPEGKKVGEPSGERAEIKPKY
jgi:capsular exopolysaccharide synthesis family protein